MVCTLWNPAGAPICLQSSHFGPNCFCLATLAINRTGTSTSAVYRIAEHYREQHRARASALCINACSILMLFVVDLPQCSSSSGSGSRLLAAFCSLAVTTAALCKAIEMKCPMYFNANGESALQMAISCDHAKALIIF